MYYGIGRSKPLPYGCCTTRDVDKRRPLQI